jgi:hypothetical protein
MTFGAFSRFFQQPAGAQSVCRALGVQPVAKIGVASLGLVIVHRNGQRLFGTNQYNQFSAPGHSGVDQIALE